MLQPECQIFSQINTLLYQYTDRLYKIGVVESNGEAIFALGRRLAATINSKQILKVWKLRIVCERLEINEKLQCNTNSRPMSVYWLVTPDLLRIFPSS
jgi:hypothetical protein